MGKTAAGVDDAATAAAAGMDDAATTAAAAAITATGTTRRMDVSAAGTATDGTANAFITSRSFRRFLSDSPSPPYFCVTAWSCEQVPEHPHYRRRTRVERRKRVFGRYEFRFCGCRYV